MTGVQTCALPISVRLIAFPKNQAGRDLMADAPSLASDVQLGELQLKLDLRKDEVKKS